MKSYIDELEKDICRYLNENRDLEAALKDAECKVQSLENEKVTIQVTHKAQLATQAASDEKKLHKAVTKANTAASKAQQLQMKTSSRLNDANNTIKTLQGHIESFKQEITALRDKAAHYDKLLKKQREHEQSLSNQYAKAEAK